MATDEDRADASAAGDGSSASRDTTLTFAGVEPSGDALLLTDANGAAYVLPITSLLRIAVKRATVPEASTLGVLQRTDVPDPSTSPREIQARVRAGESTEEIAASLGVSLDHVRRYEGPVIAEREFVAEQARAARVGHASDSPALGELVTDRLAARGAEPDSLRWDASRPGSEGWVVTVAFTIAGRERSARWSFRPQTRVIKALEDEARWLSETTISDEPIPRRHLSAVRESVFDVEASDLARPGFTRAVLDDVDGTQTVARTTEVPVLGSFGAEPAIDASSSDANAPQDDEAPLEDATAALLDDLSARRGVRQQFEIAPEPDDPLAPGTGSQSSFDLDAAPVSGAHARDEQPATNARIYALPTSVGTEKVSSTADLPGAEGAREPDPSADAAPEGAPASGTQPAAATRRATTDDAEGAAVVTPSEPTPAKPAPAARGSRKGRSKVPSWDEIVFGAKSD